MPDTNMHPMPDGASVTELVSGIIDDSQQLLKQQLHLFKSEIKQDLHKTTNAVKFLSIGGGVAAIGVFLLAFALVYLLNLLLVVWASFAIIGGIFVIVGGGLIWGGAHILRSNNPLPDQSVQALQENVQWLTNNHK